MDKLEKAIKKIEEYLREENASFCLVRSTFLWNIRKLLKEQQAEIERLKAEKDEAYEKGFKDGQNNILEAQAEGR